MPSSGQWLALAKTEGTGRFCSGFVGKAIVHSMNRTPNEGNPGDGLSELQPDFPDVGLLIATPDSKNLCNIAFHKLFGVFCLGLRPLLLLCTRDRQRPPCQHRVGDAQRDVNRRYECGQV